MKNNVIQNRLKFAFFVSLIFAGIMLCIMYINMHNAASASYKSTKALKILAGIENIATSVKAMDEKFHFISKKDEQFLKNLYKKNIEKITKEKEALNTIDTEENKENLLEFYKLVAIKTSALERSLSIFETLRGDTLINPAIANNNQTYYQNIVAKRNEIADAQRQILQNTNIARDKYATRLTWILCILILVFAIILINGYIFISYEFKKSEVLNEKLNYHSVLLNNISDAVITVDEKFDIISWNKYAEELYGFTELEVLGKPVATVMKLQKNEIDLFTSLNGQQNTWQGEMLHHKKDDSLLNVQVSMSVIYNDKNQLKGGIGVIHNITKQVKLQEDLKLLTEKLQKDVSIKSNDLDFFFERIADAFFILDNNWNYVYLNKTALVFHNVDEDVLIGNNIWELNPSVVGTDFFNVLNEVKNTQIPIRKQFYFAEQDKWYEDLIYPDKDGISIYYNDITQRKKAEIEFKKTLDKLSFHITNTPLAVLEFDSNTSILQWSKKAEEIFGWSAEDIALGAIKMDKLIHEDDIASFYEKLHGIATTNTGSKAIYNRGLTKEGKIIYCEWYNSFLKDENNNTGVMLALVKDVTVNKITEIELTNAEAKFRSLVEESLVGVYIRKDQKLQYVNPRFATIFGYSIEELYQVNTNDLIREEDIVQVHNQRKNVVARNENSMHYEFVGVRKNGETFYAEVFGNITTLNGEEVVIGTVLDITERKNAINKLNLSELALKHSNETFELVAKATKDGIWDWNMETDKLTGNDIFLNYFNYEDKNNLKFENFFDHVHIDDKKTLSDNFATAINNKTSLLTEEFRFLDKNGNHKTLFDRAYILYNEQNKAYRMLGAMQDISDIKEAENKILKAKQLSDTTVNSLPGIFFVTNKAGKIKLWNKNFETITGFSAAEMVNVIPMDLIYEGDKEMMAKRVKSTFENGSDSVEAYFVNKQGKKMPYYFTGSAIQYENEPCLLGIGIDISEKIKSQEELVKSEEKYKLLFNENPLPMWILIEGNPNFLDVNNSAIKSYGYSKKEFLEIPIINLHPPNDTAYLEWTERNDDKRYDEMYWLHQKKDGTIINVHIISNQITYNGQNATLSLAIDVTAASEAEKKLQKSTEAFRELATRLETIRENERTHMAREIHDELGQQLTGLKMDISWINRKVKSEDVAVQEKMKDTIQLIDKTVITVRRIATQLRPSILDDLGLIAAMEWQSEDFEKRAEVKSYFKTNVNHIIVKPEVATGIFRIFQESLTNVSRHAKATEVKSEFIFENDNITLTIVDNGKGFDADEVGKKKTLGLLGMKERVILLNGTYIIKGNEGVGTSVIINVPLM